MKYGKEYQRLLRESSFPKEWVSAAIEYGKLKKLIRDVVDELETSGLNPAVLHELLEQNNEIPSGHSIPPPALPPPSGPTLTLEDGSALETSDEALQPEAEVGPSIQIRRRSQAQYEIDSTNSEFTSRLRLRLRNLETQLPAQSRIKAADTVDSASTASPSGLPVPPTEPNGNAPALVSSSAGYREVSNPTWKLQRDSGDLGSVPASITRLPPTVQDDDNAEPADVSFRYSAVRDPKITASPGSSQLQVGEVVLELRSDALFFKVFSEALASLDKLAIALQEKFTNEVLALSDTISEIARPTKKHKEDLHTWREIFSLWIEAAIFESESERSRGERSVEESEIRLKAFAAELVKRGLDRSFMRGRKSKEAFDRFMHLNVSILDLKKFQKANAEAARKILKKHDKQTALKGTAEYAALIRSSTHQAVGLISPFAAETTLPHILLTTFTDKLLPVIPQIDDYMCAICTSIAFKPIRLDCSHMFCVRCLVKMQKRGQAHCPLCRARVVLKANRENVDWALLRFLQEWFPEETKAKNAANEKEAAKEELESMGYNEMKCVIM